MSLPLWTLRFPQKLAKALAFLRHPLSSRKRKAYRAQQIEALELGRCVRARPQADPVFGMLSPHKQNILHQSTDGGPNAPVRRPSISAIIPNYNHGRFLEERVRSILGQTHAVDEVIILDDASTDDSREVIRRISAAAPVPIVTAFNETNSGNIFKQWNKGLSLASTDLAWICESDDSCVPNFLDALAPYFDDPSVMIAFGRVEYIDANGAHLDDKNGHMARSNFWREPRMESAHAWFNGPFAARNIIANVGGCVFRRQQILPTLMDELQSYKICGDWFLYSRLAHGGRIAYEPRARAYFRQHGQNSSVISRKSEAFYDEHVRIARALRRHYGTPEKILELLLQNAWMQCGSYLGRDAARKFAQADPLRDIMTEKRTVPHIIITMPENADGELMKQISSEAESISSHGGDAAILIYVPVATASALRPQIAPHIPIFSSEVLQHLGAKTFLDEFGVSSVISHAGEADIALLTACRRLGLTVTDRAHEPPT